MPQHSLKLIKEFYLLINAVMLLILILKINGQRGDSQQQLIWRPGKINSFLSIFSTFWKPDISGKYHSQEKYKYTSLADGHLPTHLKCIELKASINKGEVNVSLYLAARPGVGKVQYLHI